MKNVLKSVLVVGLVFAAVPAVPAFAKGKKAAAKMHCTKDGSDVAEATSKKACKKAGGKWEKMAADTGAAAAPAPSGDTAGGGAGGGATTP